jgi:maltose O-acetyltransferase
MSDLSQLLREETEGVHGRLILARLLTAPLPVHAGSRVRALALRLAGFRIGHGTMLWGMPTITGPGDLYKRLTIGRECWLNAGCVLDLGASITISDRVALGHQVMLMTTSHALGTGERRAGPVFTRPIFIEEGAWLGARSIVLPGVHVGCSAVVAAGAVVTKNVSPHTLVGGVPARVLRELPSS